MRRTYHLVHMLQSLGGTERVVSSHDTLEGAKSAYRACGGPWHMVVRHMGLVVWDSSVAR